MQHFIKDTRDSKNSQKRLKLFVISEMINKNI